MSAERMTRANRMCSTCPFRGADDDYKRECAEITPDNWPCHTEQLVHGDPSIQCRGHFEAARRFGNAADQTQGTQHDSTP